MKSYSVVIPDSDRFVPFAIVINKGDSINWTNNDSDDHTIVSIDAVNKIAPRNINYIVKAGASYELKFDQIGQWIYYCRFHSQLDDYNQPIAPGCHNGEIGGISSKIICGNKVLTNNYGTPMMGCVTILPKDKNRAFGSVKKSKKSKKSKEDGQIIFIENGK